MKPPLQRVFIALATSSSLILSGQAKAQTFTILHNFSALDSATQTTNIDGANPYAGLILSGNILYGTAQYGGTNGNGTVFRVNTDGTGFTNLHNFMTLDPNTFTNSDGANPVAALILSGDILYGTASAGGSSDNGTVFKVNADGTGFTNVYNFTGGDDGGSPAAGLVLSGSTLYGTAYFGGTNGVGSVYAVNTNGMGFTNVYNFSAGDYDSSGYYTNSDGTYPQAGLILSGGTLYGTTYEGGTNGIGTVFAVNTNGTDFRNLHSFTALVYEANDDGAYPAASLILSGSTLYGTASLGGTNNNGTVFAINTNGSGFTTLHNFGYNDGANPLGGLILLDNILYGTAEYGGSSNEGTVFAINTNGTVFADVYGFTAIGFPVGTNSDGANPIAGLVLSGGTLYGTAQNGGTNGDGTVFSVSTNFTVQASCTLQIVTTNLPVGIVNVYYDQFLEATSCNPPFTWSANSGSLPSNMQLSSSGELSGTPTNNGMFTFPVFVTDGNNNIINPSVALNVIVPPSTTTTISHPSLSNGNFQFNLGSAGGQNYTVQFSTNLMNWVTLFNTNLPGGSTTLTFTPGSNQAGFYRAYESGIVLGSSTISVSAPAYYVSVTNGSATISLIRTGSLSNDVYINYGTSDGTAQTGVDYTPLSGTVHFGPGQTNASILVPMLIGTHFPGSTETFYINFFNTNGTAFFKAEIGIKWPPLAGPWSGTWSLINGEAPGFTVTYGTWQVELGNPDWTNANVSAVFTLHGNVLGSSSNCTNQTLVEIPLDDYTYTQTVPITLYGAGCVGARFGTISNTPPGSPQNAASFTFDTFNQVVLSNAPPSFISERFPPDPLTETNDCTSWSSYGSITGGHFGYLP